MSLFSAMPEDFLHFVWRNRLYHFQALSTSQGEKVFVRKPGIWNHDQGPDFRQARIQIGTQTWHGQVELHLQSQDWYRHGHDADPEYNNTILHVVLESQEIPIYRADGTEIPELVLGPLLFAATIQRYQQFQTQGQTIPCQNLLPELSSFSLRQVLSRMSIERMEDKTDRLQKNLQAAHGDWEQVLWQELLRLMGGPVNGELFWELGRRLPYRLIRNYLSEPEQLEILLFGEAGCLPQPSHEAFFQVWDFLKHKHQLVSRPPLPFRFSRMRPAQFPTIRLSQTAQLLTRFPQLIDLLLPENWEGFLHADMGTTVYWESHSNWDRPISARKRNIGRSQKEKLITNVLLPMAVMYARYHGRDRTELFENQLTKFTKEENRYTRILTQLGFSNEDAFDSQGLIHLYKNYCREMRCLHCQIGQQLLHQSINLVHS